jgi:periplasmic divalent cation tolerance protein
MQHPHDTPPAHAHARTARTPAHSQIKRLHPYDEPEVVALPIIGGSASYLKWLHDSTA